MVAPGVLGETILTLVLQKRDKWLSNPTKYIDDPRPLEIQWFHHRSTYRKDYVFTDSLSLVRAVKWSLISADMTLPQEIEPYCNQIAKHLITKTMHLGKASDRQLAKCQKGVVIELLDGLYYYPEDRLKRDPYWAIRKEGK